MVVACPRCRQRFDLPDSVVGGSIHSCPHCNKQVIAPDDKPEPAVPVEPDEPVHVVLTTGRSRKEQWEIDRLILLIPACLFGGLIVLCWVGFIYKRLFGA